MSFINSAQEDTQEVVQEVAQQDTQEVAQQDTQEVENIEHRQYIRTQGRKGHKKPRINLAFDSKDFLNEIRERANRDGTSITQFVNEACAYYLEKIKKDN